MKNGTIAVVLVLLSGVMTGACGSATSSGTGGGAACSGIATTNVAQNVPEAVKSKFNEVCSSYAPTPVKKGDLILGQPAAYDEVLAEEDDGGEIATGTSLNAGNINGVVYTYVTTEAGKASWGVRKWALAETSDDAKKGLSDIKINGDPQAGGSDLIVEHPDNKYPGTRYQACVVVNLPASWQQSVKNVSGDVFSIDPQILSKIVNENGNVNVNDAVGSVDIANQNGSVEVSAHSSAAVKVSNVSGNIIYDLIDSGALKNDGSLETSAGTIKITFDPGAGARLDALVDTGLISAPDLPLPAIVDIKGQRLVADVNGSGAKLTAHAETGRITIELQK